VKQSLRIAAENRQVGQKDKLTYSEAKLGNYLLIQVQDSGEGIPPDVIDQIFDPFFTTKSEGKRTGLGLSTILGIVKSHGGFVSVSSKVGKRTSFAIYLPAVTGGDEATL
jgi:signal transduction histidine kinase